MNNRITIVEEVEEPNSVPVHVGLTVQREQILARRIREHSDPIARQELIEATLPLVYYIAKRFEHSGMSREDLIAEGNLGLIRAVERFDPGCGTRFQTYARWWIRESIRHAITQHGRLIRVPDYLARRLRAWSHRRNEMQHSMQRPPADEEVRSELGLSKRQADGVLSGRRAFASAGPSDLEFQADTTKHNRRKRQEQAVVRKLLRRLDSPLQDVLELRYGLSECDSLPRTVRQTAEMLNLSAQDVRRMEREALRRLRRLVLRLVTQRTAMDNPP